MKEILLKIKNFLKSKDRFIIQNPVSFENKFSLVLSKRMTILVGTVLFLVIGILFYFIISFTSLKQYIPGFPKNAGELYEINKKNEENMVALELKTKNQDKWITNLQNILNETDTISLSDVKDLVAQDSTVDYKRIVFERSPEDSLLRKKVEQLAISPSDALVRNILKELLNFKQPHKGESSLVNEKELKETHYSADYKSPVRASMEGVIIIKKSNSVLIQHSHNLLSAYYNLDDISVEVGEQVDAGKKIGIMRESTFIFQLWYKGRTVSGETYQDL